MSKPRFSLLAIFDTLPHAVTVKTNLTAQLVGKDIFLFHGFEALLGQNEEPTLFGSWRFTNTPDRDAIRDYIRNQIRDHPIVKTWVRQARLEWHRCTHDEMSVENCTLTDYAEYIR